MIYNQKVDFHAHYLSPTYYDYLARDKRAMFTENAVRLVPRLGKILGVQVQDGTVCYLERPLTNKEKQARRMRGFISKLYSTFIA